MVGKDWTFIRGVFSGCGNKMSVDCLECFSKEEVTFVRFLFFYCVFTACTALQILPPLDLWRFLLVNIQYAAFIVDLF